MENIAAVLLVALIAQLSPGPDMILIARHATVGTYRSTFAVITGIIIGLICHATASALGLAVVLATNETLFTIIRYAGGAYLVWIGIQCLRTHSATKLGTAKTTSDTFAKGFRDGLFCNLLNPKVTLFILSIFSQMLPPDASAAEKTLLAAILVVEGFVVWLIFAALLSRPTFRTFFERHILTVDRIAGAALVLLGAAVVFKD